MAPIRRSKGTNAPLGRPRPPRSERAGGAGRAPRPNLFAHLPAKLRAELIEVIAQSAHVKIERIVSTGQTTPPGEWYDQDTNEWVIVLRGRARLRFEDERELRALAAGDHVTIAA